MTTILHVEDNADDATLVRDALSKARLPVRLDTVETGHEAIQYLAECVRDPRKAPPDLLLLDLQLPDMNGIEVLAYVNGHPELGRRLKIFVVSGSVDPAVRAVAETFFGGQFFAKTAGFKNLVAAVAKLCPPESK